MRNDVDYLIENIELRLKADDRKPSWLAKESGLEPSILSRLLKGRANPTMDTLSKIAVAFKCEAWELLRPQKAQRRLPGPGQPKRKENVDLTLKDAIDLLSLIQRGVSDRRGLGLFFLTGDPAHLQDCPEFAHAAEALARALQSAR